MTTGLPGTPELSSEEPATVGPPHHPGSGNSDTARYQRGLHAYEEASDSVGRLGPYPGQRQWRAAWPGWPADGPPECPVATSEHVRRRAAHQQPPQLHRLQQASDPLGEWTPAVANCVLVRGNGNPAPRLRVNRPPG